MAAIGNNFRQKNPKNRKNKFHLTFDEENRKDFLTGFHKRKEERKKKARHEVEKKLKAERSKVKDEKRKYVREQVLKLEKTSSSYKALDGLLKASVIDHPEHTVTVTTITDVNLDENVIGPNEVNYSDKAEESDDGDTENKTTGDAETKTARDKLSQKNKQLKKRKKTLRYMKIKKQTKIAKSKRKKERTGLKKKRKK